MIDWDKELFEKYFKYENNSLIDGIHDFSYSGNILKYQIIVDENENQVSVSADTVQPFSSESLYEFYVPCKRIFLSPKESTAYREFHFSFCTTNEFTMESLSLTISKRESDGELVVWPYFYQKAT